MACKFLLFTALVWSASCMITNFAAFQSKDDFVFIDGKQYYIATENKLNWWNAMEACDVYGMHLVSFPTVEEYNKINDFVNIYYVNETIWSSGIQFLSGFFWSAQGRTAENIQWAVNMPSKNTSSNCVANLVSQGMGNYNCNNTVGYMCQHYCNF